MGSSQLPKPIGNKIQWGWVTMDVAFSETLTSRKLKDTSPEGETGYSGAQCHSKSWVPSSDGNPWHQEGPARSCGHPPAPLGLSLASHTQVSEVPLGLSRNGLIRTGPAPLALSITGRRPCSWLLQLTLSPQHVSLCGRCGHCLALSNWSTEPGRVLGASPSRPVCLMVVDVLASKLLEVQGPV